MALHNLLVLLDDVTAVLDDVAVLSKVAAKKTAGVLGDDLALNAEQVSGVKADREIPVVWAVAKGSFLNKAILIPLALIISAISPMLVIALLMIGGAYLCFEGAEKVLHKLFHSADAHVQQQAHKEHLAKASNAAELVQMEKDKIKGAIRTDFILSAEIIVIVLGQVVADASFSMQLAILVLTGLVMTIGVYGLVAGIVKLDDLGLYWKRSTSAVFQKLGAGILVFAPWLMRALSFVGTAAMFLVGGGILVHNWPWIHHGLEKVESTLGVHGGWQGMLLEAAYNGMVGVALGLVVVAVVTIVSKLFKKPAASH